MQSAPSALRLRCGLAPSSQSQPDPHIALIYLEGGGGGQLLEKVGEREEVGGVTGTRSGRPGWLGGSEEGGDERMKGHSGPLCFTHAESLPEKLLTFAPAIHFCCPPRSRVRD